jgi:hypothetical protein
MIRVPDIKDIRKYLGLFVLFLSIVLIYFFYHNLTSFIKDLYSTLLFALEIIVKNKELKYQLMINNTSRNI